MLEACVERISQSKLVTDILVATSTEESDDQIFQFCTSKCYQVFRGSLNDVGERLHDAAKAKSCNNFLRICGDSPFIDPQIIDQAISLSETSDFDLVTNVFPRSFPKGQSVEVIKTKSLEQVLQKNRSCEHKEHVTSYIYKHHSQFRICSFSSGYDLAEHSQCIDSKQDYMTAKKLSENFSQDLGWLEIHQLWQKISLGNS